MSDALSVFGLGGLTIRRDGSPVVGAHSRKVDALVVYLVSTRQPQTREVLADLLWDEQPNAPANLRVLLSDLRKFLAPFFEITRTTVALAATADVWLDATAFENGIQSTLASRNGALDAARAADLETVLALYHGDFLQGFYIRESPRFEEWVLLEQERLRRLAVTALQQLTRFYLEQRDLARGIDKATRLFEIDPLNELTQQQMMQLLAQNGEHHAALAQYEKYSHLLAAEFHATPAPETIALRDQIRAGTFAQKISVSARSNLPRALTPFVGREHELAELGARLRDPAVPLLTLMGPGGVGKTRLALRAAEQAASHFQDGVVFVALAAVTDPELVTATIAATLDVGEVSGESTLHRIKEKLCDRDLLLLADNFEQVVDAASVLTDLLTSCPRLKVLVTSREKLHLYGEHEFLVAPLPFPDLAHLPKEAADVTAVLAHYPAVALFVQRATAAKSDFRLTTGNVRAVMEICARLEGLPLAIELAAARVQIMSPLDLLVRLTNRLNVLTGGERNRAPRHQTLRNTVEWSYTLLDERERVLFRQLAVFVGGWTLDAAERMAGTEKNVTLNLMSSLVDKSLVQRVGGTNEEPRFTMLEMLREFAMERLEQKGETYERQHLHALYFLDFAIEAQSGLNGPLQVYWLDRIEHELDNIRAALQWSVTHQETELGILLAHSLGRFWTAHNHWSEGRSWLELLLADGERPVATQLRGMGLFTTALLAYWTADYEPARVYMAQAYEFAQAAADLRLQGQVLTVMAGIDQSLGEIEQAEQEVTLGEELFAEVGNAHDIAWGRVSRGTIEMQLGHFETARPEFEAALAEFRRGGDYWSCAVALAYLGVIARLAGNTQLASECKAEALALWTLTGDKLRIGVLHMVLGSPSNESSERDIVLAYFQDAVQKNGGHVTSLAYVQNLLGLAVALHRRGEYTQATETYLQGLQVCLEHGYDRTAGDYLEGLAGIAAGNHQAARAARLFGASEALSRYVKGGMADAWRGNFGMDVATARADLDEATFNALWAEGRAMSLADAAEYAMAQGERDDVLALQGARV